MLRWLGGQRQWAPWQIIGLIQVDHAEGCHLTTCLFSLFLSMAVAGSVPKPSLTRSKPLGWLKSGPALKHRDFYLQRRRFKTGRSFVFLCLLLFLFLWKYGVLKTGNVTPRAVNSQELTDTTENTLGVNHIYIKCHLRWCHPLHCKESKPCHHRWLSWIELWMPCRLSGCSCK